MTSSRLVAAAIAAGNFLQGWDGAAIAGALLYIKPEFHLEHAPAIEGLIISCSVIGALCSTSIAGLLADKYGRRTVLFIAGVLYWLGGSGMAVTPNIYALIAFRFAVGCAYGLSATVVPLLIAETAPPDIRGQLATLPQLSNSGGTFSGYCMAFLLSRGNAPSWRVMTAALMGPSIIYVALCVFYIPESPRWLVSKGKMIAAKKVLQNLLNKENVAAELALLVEGLGSGSEATIEEYVVEHAENTTEVVGQKQEGQGIHLYGIEDNESWIAKPASEMESEQILSRYGSQTMSRFGSQLEPQALYPLMDPTVALIGSFQHPHPPNINEPDQSGNNGEYSRWDEENQADHHDAEGDEEIASNMEESMPTTPLLQHDSGLDMANSNQADSLRTPLLSQTNSEYTPNRSGSRGRVNWGGELPTNMKYPSRNSANMNSWLSSSAEQGMGLGGGWQLAWQWEKSDEPNQTGSLKRVFLFPESGPHPPSAISSMRSISNLEGGEAVQVAALVGEPALCLTERNVDPSVSAAEGTICGPAILHPSQMAEKGISWSDFADIRVRRALIVGMSLQLLQQLCGIGAVLNFTPQILEQSGVDTLLVQAGIKAESASLLASAVTCLPMLPFIMLAMFLMDRAGRRQILLSTTPVLFITLLTIALVNKLLQPGIVQGVISVVGLMVFFCAFNMGFGAVPNIFCSEIFPTRVRGMCLALCVIVTFSSNMLIIFLFPTMNKALGTPGVFGFFCIMSVFSWIFIFLKVPETKGFPLEVITEFFAVSTSPAVKEGA